MSPTDARPVINGTFVDMEVIKVDGELVEICEQSWYDIKGGVLFLHLHINQIPQILRANSTF